MRRPNFFILGAPKCGTTALHTYLRGHPQIFLPERKEPHFFSVDLRHYSWIQSQTEYLRLFEDADSGISSVGEASVFYLYSREAVPRILRFSPEARLIVMIREPVGMFASLHNQMVANGWETELDAETAWRLQTKRSDGRALPVLCDEPKLLMYGDVCSLGSQLARLFDTVDGDRVHTILFEDFIRDTEAEYARTVRFLGLDPDDRRSFPPVNVAHRPRWLGLHRLHRRIDRAFYRSSLLPLARLALAPVRPVSRLVRRVNDGPAEKSSLRPEFREELREFFAADLELLSQLLDRDRTRLAPDS